MDLRPDRTGLMLVASFVVLGCSGVALLSQPASGQTLPAGGATVSQKEGNPTSGKGRKILLSMARFVAAQRSVKFAVKFRAYEQGTMGFITPSRDFQIALAGDKQLAVQEGVSGKFVRSDGVDLMQFSNMPRLKIQGYGVGRAGTGVWEQVGRFSVKPAASMSEMLKSRVLQDFYSDDFVVRILTLLRPSLAESYLKRCRVEYLGQRVMGTKTVDHVQLEGPRQILNQKGQWKDVRQKPPFRWDIYVATGDQPVPLKIVPDLSAWVAKSVWGPDRISDSSFVFRDWTFNQPSIQEAFTLKIPEDAVYSDQMGRRDAVHPLLGKELPSFEVATAEGKKLTDKDLLTKRPTVIHFWCKTTLGDATLKTIDKLRAEYAKKNVPFVAISVGYWQRQAASKFARENKIAIDLYYDVNERIEFHSPFYGFPMTLLVGADRRVQAVYDNRIRFFDMWQEPRQEKSIQQRLAEDLDRLLAGRDIAKDKLEKLRSNQERGRSLTAEYKKRFAERSQKTNN